MGTPLAVKPRAYPLFSTSTLKVRTIDLVIFSWRRVG